MKCAVEGCPKERVHREWCKAHYLRWSRHGDPLLGGPSPKRPMSKEEAFQLEVPVRPSGDECFPWPGESSGGYGYVLAENKMWKAHRLSYELFVGEIPEGQVIRHQCDNPPCINPNHLLFGTQADNVKDMVSRSRQNIGAKNGATRLTEEEVREIRSLQGKLPASEIASRYGLNRRTVNKIHNREHWKYLI